jgi:hypothetical protein
MQILIHADGNIEMSNDLVGAIEDRLRSELDRFSPALMRVDVHLSDINGTHFEVNDKACTLSIHVARRSPVTVSDRAPSSILSVEGATAKAARLLDAAHDRQVGHPGDRTIRRMQAEES